MRSSRFRLMQLVSLVDFRVVAGIHCLSGRFAPYKAAAPASVPSA